MAVGRGRVGAAGIIVRIGAVAVIVRGPIAVVIVPMIVIDVSVPVRMDDPVQVLVEVAVRRRVVVRLVGHRAVFSLVFGASAV